MCNEQQAVCRGDPLSHLICGTGQHVDAYNGRFVGATGEAGANGADPTFVTLREASFEWITKNKLQLGDNDKDMEKYTRGHQIGDNSLHRP